MMVMVRLAMRAMLLLPHEWLITAHRKAHRLGNKIVSKMSSQAVRNLNTSRSIDPFHRNGK